ncbi:hypothetical protein SNE40_006370 [Patella caerulea]|uniref:Eukaryotic translation initiation factor 3 subunit C n=1 Tax=Patella caerulea TaxID=87958 RepID=A0AAN8JTW7_PATCE
MSRFFKAGSDSESETESSEDDEIIQQRPSAAPVQSRTFQFSDDEDDSRRIVRSAKDKRFDEMTNIIQQMKNHKQIKDMANVLNDFEALIKAADKAKKVIQEEGVPRFFIRCLFDLEEYANECWEDKEWRKSISKNNSKSFTSLRQKLKKYIREKYEKEVNDYKENPDQGDDDKRDETPAPQDEESEDEVDTSVKAPVKPKLPAPPVIKKQLPKSMDDDDDDDDDIDWDSSDDSVESDIDDEQFDTGKLTAEYFLKKSDSGTSKKEKKRKEPKQMKLEETDEEGDWEEVKGGAPLIMERPKMFGKDQEINVDAVLKKLYEITSARGKKGTDRNEQIELLKELREIAETNNLGLGIDVKLYFNIIGAIFDYNPNTLTSMRNDVWESCLSYLQTLLNILIDHPEVNVGEHIKEDDENLTEAPLYVRGCFLTLVEKMDEEFTKMLQSCDAHSTEYVERLQDERQVCDILEKTLRYLEIKGTTLEISRIYLKRIEHLYYKFDTSCVYTGDNEPKKEGTSEQTMDKLCKFLYTSETPDRLRTRAILCHIYHHALHNRWFQARDLMLMSHLQDNIGHSDIPTQLLYNRTLVQLGLCAFRQGNIRDAHNALVDIQSSNRAKELLAQGLLPNRQNERTPEQEKIEKRRLFPYHMHINLELLECVYLVSAMLLEIPFMAAHEMDVRRRMISKNFHHVMKMSERQTLIGPPESMREHVVAASKSMKTGDWKACKNFIINDKMNAKVWDLFFQPDKVRDMITVKIQEESLRTYLFTYSNVYDTLSLHTLAEMFELDMSVVHRIISKMIINEELMASLAEPTQTVIMHRTEPSRLQSLALQLSDKFLTLVENNERILEVKQGIYPFQNKRDRNDRQPGTSAAFQHHTQGVVEGEGYGPPTSKSVTNNQHWNRRNNKNYSRESRNY